MTKRIHPNNNLLALLDGPYPNNPTKSTLRCDRLLLIGGCIGITGLIPWLHLHPNAKLAWNSTAVSWAQDLLDCPCQVGGGWECVDEV